MRALASNPAAARTGLDKPSRKFTIRGCTGHPELDRGFGGHRELGARRQVNCRRRSVFKNAHASADFLPMEALSLSRDYPGQNDHTKLVGLVGKAQRLARS